MKKDISDEVAAAVIRRCTVDNFRGFQTKTQGYCRSFLARYYKRYMGEKNEWVYRNMQMVVRGFNDEARFMKEELLDGETVYSGDVYVSGALETYDDNYGIHSCITIINDKGIIKLPSIGGL